MTDALGRVADKGHYQDDRGPAWQQDGSLASSAADVFNLISTPTFTYDVTEDGGTGRTVIQILPDGLNALATVGGIDAFSTGFTTLLTVPTGLSLQVLAVHLRCTAAVGVTGEAQARVVLPSGNVYAQQVLTGLNTSGLVYRFPSGGKKVVGAAGELLRLEIVAPATGTSQTLEAQVYGRIYV